MVLDVMITSKECMRLETVLFIMSTDSKKQKSKMDSIKVLHGI
jgi:hypothetical protein